MRQEQTAIGIEDWIKSEPTLLLADKLDGNDLLLTKEVTAVIGVFYAAT